MGLDQVKEIAMAVGGTIEQVGVLPDGSGFATMSMELPKNHWIYQAETKFEDGSGYVGDPPAPLRMGAEEEIFIVVGKTERGGKVTLHGFFSKSDFANMIRGVGKYAVRASTMCGKAMDFDPDAMLQNLVTGFLGYHTVDGFSHLDEL